MNDSMLTIAFKEWAVVCKALADGVQSIILRKGGIAENAGEFRPEHTQFWLYPTYFHEHRAGIREQYLPLLDAAESERPPAGVVRLTHFAEVRSVQFLDDLDNALALGPHIWTDEIVKQRFHYRKPGLFVLNVQVFAVPSPIDVPERPEYAGCKTWVTLAEEKPNEISTKQKNDTK